MREQVQADGEWLFGCCRVRTVTDSGRNSLLLQSEQLLMATAMETTYLHY